MIKVLDFSKLDHQGVLHNALLGYHLSDPEGTCTAENLIKYIATCELNMQSDLHFPCRQPWILLIMEFCQV